MGDVGVGGRSLLVFPNDGDIEVEMDHDLEVEALVVLVKEDGEFDVEAEVGESLVSCSRSSELTVTIVEEEDFVGDLAIDVGDFEFEGVSSGFWQFSISA